MRAYWLTQYLLTTVFWRYLAVSIAALAPAFWLHKGKRATTVVGLVVLAMVAILPIQALRDYLKEAEAAEMHRGRLHDPADIAWWAPTDVRFSTNMTVSLDQATEYGVARAHAGQPFGGAVSKASEPSPAIKRQAADS